jgi:Flp pilus assembly protein TadD
VSEPGDRLMQRLTQAEPLINQAKAAQAEAACRAVLRDAPDMPAAMALLGFIVARLRRLAEAEQLLRQPLVLRPDVPHWHFELCNVLRYDFRLDEALAEAHEAARLDPSSAQFRNGLSQVHCDLGRSGQGYTPSSISWPAIRSIPTGRSRSIG